MNPNAQFERDLEEWLKTEAPVSAPAGFHATVMDRARTLRQRPGWTTTLPARRIGRGRGLTLLAAAAVLLVGGALVAGSGVLPRPAVVPPVPAPAIGPVAVASPDATSPSPGNLASTSPSPTVPPITWTQASLKQDWPAPARTEAAGGASVAPMPPTYIDPSGDSGSDATPYVDIRDVTAGTKALSFDLVSKPPNVDPSQAWIAYGVVVDVDRDGVPDWRYGMDNLPRAAGEDQTHHRAWRTNLHTGVTEFYSNASGSDEMDQVGNTHFGSSYPATENGPSFLFYETGDVTGGGEFKLGAKQDKPFYVWASAIVGGQVVATDYAPDTGWLDPTLGGTNPGGTYLLSKLADAPSPFRLTLTVPQGWTAAGGFLSPSQDDGLGLQFLIADHPAEWACDASGRALKPPVGPSVDDLVTFLARQQPQGMITISSTTDVTLDGYRGTYLEYTTSYDENTNCQPTEWPFDRTGFHQVWILDVEGVRLVIDASAPRTSDVVKAQFGQIVDSIAIEPSTALEPVPSPTPTPTPTPVPTPTPTPFPPAEGPVPQGARSWEVTVENKSSKAATLFLAREPLNDMGDLCGSVTPDVVPAGVTEKVTFQLPPKSVNDCWLMVRPGPGASGDHGPTNEWPIPGKLLIQDGGDNSNGDDLSDYWVGP